MNKSIKMLTSAALLIASPVVFGQTKEITAAKPTSGYVQDGRGAVATDPYGLCWRTGYFTPALAQVECDPDLVPKPVVAAAPPPPASAPAPKPVVAPVVEKITYSADAFFDFDKSVLKPEAKTKLDDLIAKSKGLNLEIIIAVGHTDSIGSDAYNQKLSMKRAESVKAYLISKGIELSRVYTEGKGEKQPAASNKTAEGRAKNRRVEIEVVGTHSTK